MIFLKKNYREDIYNGGNNFENLDTWNEGLDMILKEENVTKEELYDMFCPIAKRNRKG